MSLFSRMGPTLAFLGVMGGGGGAAKSAAANCNPSHDLDYRTPQLNQDRFLRDAVPKLDSNRDGVLSRKEICAVENEVVRNRLVGLVDTLDHPAKNEAPLVSCQRELETQRNYNREATRKVGLTASIIALIVGVGVGLLLVRPVIFLSKLLFKGVRWLMRKIFRVKSNPDRELKKLNGIKTDLNKKLLKVQTQIDTLTGLKSDKKS